jgi:hypothetical protein
MKLITGIPTALLASSLFNLLLLAVLNIDRKGSNSYFWRFVDAVAEPPTLVANAFFQSLTPAKLALGWLAVSIVYFTVIIWAVMALFHFIGHLRTSTLP